MIWQSSSSQRERCWLQALVLCHLGTIGVLLPSRVDAGCNSESHSTGPCRIPSVRLASSVADASLGVLGCSAAEPSQGEWLMDSPYWAFSTDTRLLQLPDAENAYHRGEVPPLDDSDPDSTLQSVGQAPLQSGTSSATLSQTTEVSTTRLGKLLPPIDDPILSQPQDGMGVENNAPFVTETDMEALQLDNTNTDQHPDEIFWALPPVEEPAGASVPSAALPAKSVQKAERGLVVDGVSTAHGLSPEELHLLRLIERDKLSVSTGALTDERLDRRAREKITRACQLAQRGATYAARKELVEVLRLVSQAKDNREGGRTRSESLSAGLRALDEAEDFLPQGTQLEADMPLDVICAAHRTPIGRELAERDMLPSQLLDRYNRYAQIKLAVAVAGEPAGSMALYTLGKLNSQMAEHDDGKHRLARRRALAMQQAALLAHNQNYLAAHELGVLMAESGHFAEANRLFAQVALQQPNSVVYGNLAHVQEEMGLAAAAGRSRAQAKRLAQQGSGPPAQIAWVSPQEFSNNPVPRVPAQVASQGIAPAYR